MANALSRLPNHDDGSNDNTEVIVLKPAYFQTRATVEVDSLEARVQTAQDIHDLIVVTNRYCKLDQWKVDDKGTIWVKERLYVPKDAILRGEILWTHHDLPLAGHLEWHGTQNLIERTFFWPGLSWDVH